MTYCEHCGQSADCVVCDRIARSVAEDAADALRDAERELAECRARVVELEFALPGLRVAAGRRPGDGSDQGTLFGVEEQLELWSVLEAG